MALAVGEGAGEAETVRHHQKHLLPASCRRDQLGPDGHPPPSRFAFSPPEGHGRRGGSRRKVPRKHPLLDPMGRWRQASLCPRGWVTASCRDAMAQRTKGLGFYAPALGRPHRGGQTALGESPGDVPITQTQRHPLHPRNSGEMLEQWFLRENVSRF